VQIRKTIVQISKILCGKLQLFPVLFITALNTSSFISICPAPKAMAGHYALAPGKRFCQ